MRRKTLIFLGFLFFQIPVFADSQAKIFSAAGDGTSWQQAANWSPAEIPKITDDVTINLKDVFVTVKNDFQTHSIFVGGRTTSTFEAESFVYGKIVPASNLNEAMWIRKQGNVILKGAGVVTLKGSLKISDDALPDEPSPMAVLI